MCECVEWQRRSARLPQYQSAGVSVCTRQLTALRRDSASQRWPCVPRRACLFANSEGEKGKREGEDEECCSKILRLLSSGLSSIFPPFLRFSSSQLIFFPQSLPPLKSSLTVTADVRCTGEIGLGQKAKQMHQSAKSCIL